MVFFVAVPSVGQLREEFYQALGIQPMDGEQDIDADDDGEEQE